jgi:hypothetical protein
VNTPVKIRQQGVRAAGKGAVAIYLLNLSTVTIKTLTDRLRLPAFSGSIATAPIVV